MKRIAMSLAALVLVGSFSIPVFAQEPKEKNKEKKETETITITRKNVNTDEKTIIEIQGDKIIINGKPSTEIKDGSVNVRRNRRSPSVTYSVPGQGNWDVDFFNVNENQAMLGVVTLKTEKGVEVSEITDESAAEKAGLKEGDIITKVNDTKIEDPDDLSDLIRKKKPGEKVTVTFLRDKKEQKVTAELGKWRGPFAYGMSTMPDMKIFEDIRPHLQEIPRAVTPYSGQGFTWSGGNQKLGLSVQDTEDGKGVKVIEVDEGSNAAKAGVKEGDIITHVNDKEVNGADEVAKIVRESREKGSINLKLTRDKKNLNIEVKIPRRIRTAEL